MKMKDIKDMTLEEVQYICRNHFRCAGCPFDESAGCSFDTMPKYWADSEGDEDTVPASCESLHHVEEPELTVGSLVSPYPFKDTVEPEPTRP